MLVLWTLFDLCTCWALDSSSWVHRKFMTLHMHTCDNRSLSVILSCHHHLRLLSLILLLFLVTMTGLPSNSFSAAHTLAPSVFFSFCCSVFFFFVLLHSASHVVTQQLLPCLSSNSQWVTPFLSLSFFFSLLETENYINEEVLTAHCFIMWPGSKQKCLNINCSNGLLGVIGSKRTKWNGNNGFFFVSKSTKSSVCVFVF